MRPQNEIVNDEHDFDNHAKKVIIVGGGLTVDNATVNVGDVGLRNTSEVVINPATEEKQSLIVDAINNLGNIGATTIVKGGSVLSTYETHDLDEAGTTTYVGLQDPQGNWCIKKIVETSGDLDITYSNESNNGSYTVYASAWIGRASLTYADLSTLTFPAVTEAFANHYVYSAKVTLLSATSGYFMALTDGLQTIFENFLIKSDRNDIDIEFYESPTTTSNGTLQTTINTDRTSAQTSTMLVYTNPVVTSDGTLLYRDALLGETKAGGGDAVVLDWKFKSGTKYIFKLTNNGAQSAVIVGNFKWREF